MSTTKKQSKLVNKSITVFPKRRHIFGAVVALVVGVVGSYLLLAAHASSPAGHATFADTVGDSGYVWPDAASIPKEDRSDIGQIKTRQLYTKVPPATWLLQSTGRMHLTITVGDGEGTYQKPPGYSCNTALTCVSTARRQDHGVSKRDFSLCIDVPGSLYNRQISLLSFKSRIHDSPYQGGISMSYSWSEGTCYAPTGNLLYAIQGVDWATGGRAGVWTVGEAFGPDVSSGPGPKLATSKGIGGEGTGTKGTGQGGGGGGSSANTQSNKPNSLPTTTSQGNNKQPTLNPSPFYDGKEYAPGSDPLDKTFGNISVAGRKIAHGWVYLLGVVAIVGGVVGYYLWRRRKS